MSNPLDVIEWFPSGEPKKYQWEVDHPEWGVDALVDTDEIITSGPSKGTIGSIFDVQDEDIIRKF